MLLASCGSKADVVIESDYLVVASDTVMADEAWSAVVQTLAKKHNAEFKVFRMTGNFKNVHDVPEKVFNSMKAGFQNYPGEVVVAAGKDIEL